MAWPFSSPFDFVVLGPGRSGTSLVGALLDGHSQLQVALEDYVWDELLGHGPSAAQDPEAHLARFLQKCHQAARAAGKPHWGHKITTEQCLLFSESAGPAGEEWLYQKLLAPRKLIFVQRDGRACVYSKIQRTGRPEADLLAYWRHSVALLRLLRARQHPHLYLLKYEDLLQNPEAVMRDVLAFLGQSYEAQIWEATAGNRILADYRQPGLAAEKALVPAVARRFGPALAEELRYLGYDPA